MSAAGLPPGSIDDRHLRLLRIFRAVAEAGGLTAAEAQLSMERSTISRHLQALERQLGATLCHRGPAGFELTEFGRVALKVAIAAGDTLDMARNELDRARNAVSGDLYLGVADNCISNPRSQVHRAVAAFREQAPNVTLHVSIAPSVDLQEGLLSRRLNIAITGLAAGQVAMRHHALFSEEMRLYVGLPQGGAAPSVEELAARRFVMVLRRHHYRTLSLAKRLKLERRTFAQGLEAVATLLAGGGFVGYLPTHYAAAVARQHHLAEVSGAERLAHDTKIVLATMQSHELSPAGRLLADLLLQAHRA
ncbi:MAG: LysR family transcriptional regulator [Roseococcus sp.]|nr:LysR family transcriptional regulator [Roseococcus sp.]